MPLWCHNLRELGGGGIIFLDLGWFGMISSRNIIFKGIWSLQCGLKQKVRLQRTRITKLVSFCAKLQWWNVSKSSVTVNCLKYQNFEGLEMFEIMNLYGSPFKFQCFSNMWKTPPNFWSRLKIIHVWCIGWPMAQLLNPLACAKSWSPKRQDWPERRVEEIFCKSGEGNWVVPA